MELSTNSASVSRARFRYHDGDFRTWLIALPLHRADLDKTSHTVLMRESSWSVSAVWRARYSRQSLSPTAFCNRKINLTTHLVQHVR